MRLQNKSIVTNIILTFVTCGIFGIFWFIALVNDVKYASNDESLPSGGIAFLLGLITCGIYLIYIFYKLGLAMVVANEKNGLPANKDNAVIYLVLCILGLGIVNYCLIQSELNAIASKQA